MKKVFPLFFPLFTNSVDILFWGWLSIIPNDARESHNRINWIRAISGRVEILLVQWMVTIKHQYLVGNHRHSAGVKMILKDLKKLEKLEKNDKNTIFDWVEGV